MQTTKLLSFFLAIALFTFLACDDASNQADALKDKANAAKDKATEMAKDAGKTLEAAGGFTAGPVTPKDTIPQDSATAWAQSWENVMNSANIPLIQGFTLPIIDLQQIVNENADSARFYLGKNGSGEYKLFAVGVNSSGEDMVNTNPKTPLERIYDLSTPCPPVCGSTIGK